MTLRYDPQWRGFVDEYDKIVGYLHQTVHDRDPTLGHKMAAAEAIFEALKGMLSPWDGFTKNELKRRHILGVIDTPDLVRILRAHDALAKAAT